MANFKINAAGKQIFLDVFHTPSSVLPATEIPAEILKRFEAAGMSIVLEKGVTQDAFAKAVMGAYTALGLSYRNRIKVQTVVPKFSFDLDELPTVEAETLTPNNLADILTTDLVEETPDGEDVVDENYDLELSNFGNNGLAN